eukprot:Tbor_TRINITY_DN5011_c0_g2::TRINITY_DN5011_c0_g2_i1::g.14373::m.14373/K18404/TDRD3; tudor domain-containing protein 3
MLSRLLDQVKEKYHVNISEQALMVKFSSDQRTDIVSIYKAALQSNFFDITSPGILPSFLSSQVSTETKFPMLLQIVAAKDVTQPLRPCADMTEDEAFIAGAPGQLSQYNKHRLLKLILSDGHCEIPAIELTTLTNVFKSIPVPGEKVLVKEGTEVRNGMLIMSPLTISHVGGFVTELLKEFELRKRGLLQPKGAEGAPKFTPFVKRQTHHDHFQHPQDVGEISDRAVQRVGFSGEAREGRGRARGGVRGGFERRDRGKGDGRGRYERGRGSPQDRGGRHVDVNSNIPQRNTNKVKLHSNAQHSVDSYEDFPDLGGDW